MKKKLILAIVPALLSLASCSNVKKEIVQNNANLFVEDTLAHEEIFGDVEQPVLATVRKLAPIDSSVPAIAIQTKTDGVGDSAKISIRFVAAVRITGTLSDATAVWTRTMYGADGHAFKQRANKACAKAYTSINDNGASLDIGAFNTANGGTNYTHFVVYSMLNIPTAGVNDASNYYLNAYLTLNDGGATTSKVVATKVDQSTKLSFNVSDTSYFGVKKTATGYVTFDRAETPKSGNHASFDNIVVNSGESFVIVNNWVDNEHPENDFFEVHGYSSIEGNRGFTQVGESQFAQSTSDSPYYFYLSSTSNNKIYINKSISKTLTLNPGVWSADNPNYELYVGDNDGHGTTHWYDLSGSGSAYSVSVSNIPDAAVLIFCRMNPSGTAHDWSGKWNQTNDLSIADTGNNTYTISGWGGEKSPGSWGVAA